MSWRASSWRMGSTSVGLVNGGIQRPPTLLRKRGEAIGTRVIARETSDAMRALMRMVVESGTGLLLLPGAAIWAFAPEKVLAMRKGWAESEPVLAGRLIRAIWRAGALVGVSAPA